jgi:Cellulose binding domain
MARKRLRLTVYLSAAALAVGGGALAAVAATAPSGGLTASFSKDSDWGTGYQARYTIRNAGGAAVDGWTVRFGLPQGAKLGSAWEATVTTSGSITTAANKGYNGTVPAGGSVEFGFIVTGSGDPTSCTVNGAPCDGGAPAPTTPTTAPTTRPPATTPPTTAPTTRPPTTRPPTTPTTQPTTTPTTQPTTTPTTETGTT